MSQLFRLWSLYQPKSAVLIVMPDQKYCVGQTCGLIGNSMSL